MLKNFRTNKPEQTIENANPVTGEIPTGPITTSASRAIEQPNLEGSFSVEEIAGPLPTFFNLKDHPDFDGKKIAVVAVSFADSTLKPGEEFVKLGCFVIEDGKPGPAIVIMTGAESIVERARVFSGIASMKTPIVGTLRSVGRAWLLE